MLLPLLPPLSELNSYIFCQDISPQAFTFKIYVPSVVCVILLPPTAIKPPSKVWITDKPTLKAPRYVS